MKPFTSIFLFFSLNTLNSQVLDSLINNFIQLENFELNYLSEASLYKDSIKQCTWIVDSVGHLKSKEQFRLANNLKTLYSYDESTLKEIQFFREDRLVQTKRYHQEGLKSITYIFNEQDGNSVITAFYNEKAKLLSINTKRKRKHLKDTLTFNEDASIKQRLIYNNDELIKSINYYYQKDGDSKYEKYYLNEKVVKTIKAIKYKNITETFCAGDSCQYDQTDYLYRKKRVWRIYQYNKDTLAFSHEFKYNKYGELIEYIKLKGPEKKEVQKRFYYYTYEGLPEEMIDYTYTALGVKETKFHYLFDYYE